MGILFPGPEGRSDTVLLVFRDILSTLSCYSTVHYGTTVCLKMIHSWRQDDNVSPISALALDLPPQPSVMPAFR